MNIESIHVNTNLMYISTGTTIKARVAAATAKVVRLILTIPSNYGRY